MYLSASYHWLHLIVAALYYITPTLARGIGTKSLVTCIENSKISANEFELLFNPDDNSAHYKLNLNTEIDDYILVDIAIYAYGLQLFRQTFNPCSAGWKQFCPLHPGKVEIDSVEYIPNDFTGLIPGIAYTVPDVDASAKILFYEASDLRTPTACVQMFFSNGKTISLPAVKWVIGLITLSGLIIAALLHLFGKSTSSSHIVACLISLFLYFQSVSIVSMQHVQKLPPLAEAWSENLAWTMGLIRVGFMQKIFRWFVAATGGSPSLFLTSTIIAIFPQRRKREFASLAYSLRKRANDTFYGNESTIIFRGIKRLATGLNLECTSVVLTAFTFFMTSIYILFGFTVISKQMIELLVSIGWIKPSRLAHFRRNWKPLLKGSIYHFIFLGFAQITALSCWEYTERDSAAVIVMTTILLVSIISLMLLVATKVVIVARRSIRDHGNPTQLLFGQEDFYTKYGFFYKMFKSNFYWWNIYLLTTIFMKASFIGFGQSSGKTESIAFFVLDLLYLFLLMIFRPYLNLPMNVLNIFIAIVVFLNSTMFTFFSEAFSDSYMISAILGVVFVIMNISFSGFLIFLITVFTIYISIISNPNKSFFAPKDGRIAYQKDFSEYLPVSEDSFSLLQESTRTGSINWDHSISISNAHGTPKEFDKDGFTLADMTTTTPVRLDSNDEASLVGTPSTSKTLTPSRFQSPVKIFAPGIFKHLKLGKIKKHIILKDGSRQEIDIPDDDEDDDGDDENHLTDFDIDGESLSFSELDNSNETAHDSHHNNDTFNKKDKIQFEENESSGSRNDTTSSTHVDSLHGPLLQPPPYNVDSTPELNGHSTWTSVPNNKKDEDTNLLTDNDTLHDNDEEQN
ncbi:hypothetical protein TBLA_0A06050 [Henningerozyma blattae CBS 6284]|uniref:ML-like domain-containing protein n=1 Tax=Henningerozyma blattae (strain ATCC 34711 / CBS 6284 / DSM 70876 / NBRC 10599 / NRRL Y-10934 / UCD 77-7) TaxID=1071380 RepID=I2GW96_HENB6|nr:hypothetical protein TBLA_0A06050 [Tetrapisispora blattae CBS 6284]CCH58398.1 hypothetical protein TBLA_0A06050 [Tetrapisispora blattae CBS 6284]